jgi:hypothetical protein
LTINTDINVDTIQTNVLEVVLYDENTSRKDAFIGKGDCSLLKCGSEGFLGAEVELTVALLDEKQAPAGRMYCM